MVRAYLRFRPGREQEMLAERNDLLVLYESLCTVEKHLLLVLIGLIPIRVQNDLLKCHFSLTPASLFLRSTKTAPLS